MFPIFKESLFARLEAFPGKRVSRQRVLQPSGMDHAAIPGAVALLEMKSLRRGQSLPV